MFISPWLPRIVKSTPIEKINDVAIAANAVKALSILTFLVTKTINTKAMAGKIGISHALSIQNIDPLTPPFIVQLLPL